MTLYTQNHPQTHLSSSQQSYPQRWWALGVLCFCMLMVVVDNTIVNIALPTVARELSASSSELQWIVEAYTLVLAGLLLTCGTLTDRIGNKYALMIGLTLFALASTLAAFTPSTLLLIVARGAMGIGGAFIMPATLSTIRKIFPAEERARAIGIWSSISGLGIVIGPLAGGWLINHFWWGSIFLVNIPVATIAVCGTLLFVPNLRHHASSPIDGVGTLLSILGMSALVYTFTEAPIYGWTSPLTILLFAFSVSCLTIFVLWERRTMYPMLNLQLFTNPHFSAASFSVTLAYFALFGFMFFITQHLQAVMGYTPLEAGIRLIPQAAAILVASLIASWLINKIGRKYVVVGGLLMVALGLLGFSRITVTTDYPLIATLLVVVTAGIGIAGTAAADSIMSAVPEQQAGSAASVDETAVELGGTLGIAVLGSILASTYAAHIQSASNLPLSLRNTAQASIGVAIDVAQTLERNLGAQLIKHAHEAFVLAMSHASLVAAGISLVGAIIAAIFLPSKAVQQH